MQINLPLEKYGSVQQTVNIYPVEKMQINFRWRKANHHAICY